jgi:thiol-disulfide isomerase/thioredoxin
MSDRGGCSTTARDVSQRRRLATAAVAVLAFAGCAQPAGEEGALSAVTHATATVEVTVADRAGVDGWLADQRGKVVLVDFWAPWCRPCMEQLPHTFDLARASGDKLAVATVCMEDPEDREKIAKTLAARGAKQGDPLQHFLCEEGGGSAGMEALEIPGGALPVYRIYDRSGKLQREFALDLSAEKQFTSEDVATAVETLLAK